MIGKVLSFAILTAAMIPAVTAQTPAQPPTPEARAFSFSWDSEGGYLGVQTEEVTRENLGKFGLREVRGVAIAKVLDDSPARAAGLQDGDVIVRINGDEISSGRKLTRLINEISPDHTAKVTVLRGGAEREISVTLGKRPMPRFAERAFNMPEGFEKFNLQKLPEFEKFDFKMMPELDKLEKYKVAPGALGEHFGLQFGNRRQIGVSLTPLSKQLSDHFGVSNGALVNTVRQDSPAARAGLKAGDVILEVDGKPVKGEMDVARAIGEKKEGDISLTYIRGGQRQTLRITPEKGEGNLFQHFDMDSNTPEPGTPGTPTPLNQLFIPGRVV